MSVSSSSDFNQTRDQIISDALITLGVYRPGATVSTNDYNICSNWLNKIVKSWDAKGIHMWTQVEGTLFLVSGQCKYTITGNTVAGDNVVETLLTADGSGTTLTVTSTTGMNVSDNVAIQLDANTLQFTTISSVDSTTQLTIATPLTSSSSSGNTVFAYTTPASRILHITEAVCRDNSSVDSPIFIKNRDEYLTIADKTTTASRVNQLFWTSTRSDGDIYVWPTPDNCSYRIKYNYTRAIQDFDSSSDNPDFPVEWLNCLTLNLMSAVSGVYGKNLKERQTLKADAAEELMEMQLWDIGAGGIRTVPAPRDDE